MTTPNEVQFLKNANTCSFSFHPVIVVCCTTGHDCGRVHKMEKYNLFILQAVIDLMIFHNNLWPLFSKSFFFFKGTTKS